jgi:AmmeMemoRadiSam system protein B
MSRPSHRPFGSADGRPTRPPAVAGRFYPRQPGALAGLVDDLLDAVDVPADEPLAAAYVVPHAGYQFSGPTAGLVYARLRRHADRVRRVILLGPAHYVPLKGCAAPAVAGWVTALGEVRIDEGAVRALAHDGHVAVDDGPHAPEHSLEVQLPFLQRALPATVPVLPILVGTTSVDDVVVTLAAAVDRGTVVLCSTDLSHYQTRDAAQRQDARTAQAVLDLAAERIGVRDACGVYALRGVVGWARHDGLSARLLHLCTSADTTGDAERVVGYGAFAFSRSAPAQR